MIIVLFLDIKVFGSHIEADVSSPCTKDVVVKLTYSTLRCVQPDK